MANTSPPQSPCISICTLDDNDVCMGCHRTLDEIIDWGMLSDSAKQQILDAVAVRAAEQQKAG